MEIADYIILVVFAIGYVIIYLIQRGQIGGLKERLHAIESYAKIFDPEKVAKHVENMEKGARQDAINLLFDKLEMKQLLNDAVQKNLDPLRDIYGQEMNKEYSELFALAYSIVIQNTDNRKNLALIFGKLPSVSAKLLEIVKDERGIDLTPVVSPDFLLQVIDERNNNDAKANGDAAKQEDGAD